MSDINQMLEELERKIAQFQFRTGRNQRYRVYRKLEGMLRMNEALSRSLDRLYLNASEMGKYPRRPAAGTRLVCRQDAGMRRHAVYPERP